MFQGAISSSKSINSNNINFNDFTKEELVAALMNANESVQLYIKKELIK
ncbi:hypothetical protein [Mammaliicoccus sciuri]|nr:hypothetical protein [Mammaliicoccus sciuri]